VSGEAVISTNRLTKRFGSFTALREVTLDVTRASIFGMLGPNGAGKSTLIRVLCGVLRPSEGEASVLGLDLRRDPEAVKPRIGYMSQRFSLYADLSVVENVRFYGRVYGLSPAKLREREDAVLQWTGVGAYADRAGGQLSGGWKQRLALACSLIHEPEVLFLDEPTAGIDPVARRDLWDLLFALSHQGVTMFVTTHYMDEAERCTQVAYIQAARLLVLGTPEALKASPKVTPSGTMRHELVCGDLPAALARARRVPAIRDATLFGTALHVLANESLDGDELARLLAPGDTTVTHRPIAPSLEDVFVTLSRAESATEAA